MEWPLIQNRIIRPARQPPPSSLLACWATVFYPWPRSVLEGPDSMGTFTELTAAASINVESSIPGSFPAGSVLISKVIFKVKATWKTDWDWTTKGISTFDRPVDGLAIPELLKLCGWSRFHVKFCRHWNHLGGCWTVTRYGLGTSILGAGSHCHTDSVSVP